MTESLDGSTANALAPAMIAIPTKQSTKSTDREGICNSPHGSRIESNTSSGEMSSDGHNPDQNIQRALPDERANASVISSARQRVRQSRLAMLGHGSLAG